MIVAVLSFGAAGGPPFASIHCFLHSAVERSHEKADSSFWFAAEVRERRTTHSMEGVERVFETPARRRSHFLTRMLFRHTRAEGGQHATVRIPFRDTGAEQVHHRTIDIRL